MSVAVSIPTMSNELCGQIGTLVLSSALAGAIPEAGGALAGIFGTINGACTMHKSGTDDGGKGS